MYSKAHLALSVAVGAAGAVPLADGALAGALLVGYAALVGVGIDADHFLVARANAGDWRALRFCLRNPTVPFVAQDRIFRTDEVGKLDRLLSHALLGGALVAVLAAVAPALAAFTAAVLYVHVVADLVADVRDVRAPPAGL